MENKFQAAERNYFYTTPYYVTATADLFFLLKDLNTSLYEQPLRSRSNILNFDLGIQYNGRKCEFSGHLYQFQD